MDIAFKCPMLGENIHSATVVNLLVKEGDIIELDQPVVEIESEKAAAEVPVTVAGKVKKIMVKSGDLVKEGEPLILIEVQDEKTVAPPEKTATLPENSMPITEKAAASTQKISVPTEKVPLASEKITLPAEKITAPIERERPSKEDLEMVLPGSGGPTAVSPIAAAPSVRRFAREIGVDILKVKGSSGEHGRISLEDVKNYAKEINERLRSGGEEGKVVRSTRDIGEFGTSTIGRGTPYPSYHEPLPDFSKWGEISTETMSSIRKKTAEHLSFAWNTIPAVTQFDKADITQLDKWRKNISSTMEKQAVKLTVTAILVKILVSALKAFPKFNTSIDMENNLLIFKKYFNIAVAVDTDRGLLVPIIKNADDKNLITIALELQELSKRARERKLTLEEMQGGSITISNLGGIGGTYFTPIINSPEVAILGISKAEMQNIYLEGSFVPRLIMPLSLTYDHRVIDGAEGIRFLRYIVNSLENPLYLL